MSVTVKSQREIELMREAGKILGTVLNELEKECKPGVTTYHINKIGEEMIKSYGCIPSFKGYQGYPAAICVSVNDEIVHGIPSKKRVLKEGDVVSLDAGVIHKGYHSDAARTYGIGKISDEAAKLIEVTRQSFFEGIKYAKEGCHLYEISNAIAQYNESFGYGVIRDLVGHGIGCKPERYIQYNPSQCPSDAETEKWKDHQYFFCFRNPRKCGPGKLCCIQSRCDRSDKNNGKRAGQPGNYGKCHCTWICRNRDDRSALRRNQGKCM